MIREQEQDNREGRIEGRNPFLEALRSQRTIEKVWVQKASGRRDRKLHEMLQEARQHGAVVAEVSKEILDNMALTSGHQGIIAQVAAHEYVQFDRLMEAAAKKSAAPFLLFLDKLKDSFNLGSILRIADAAGIDGIVIPKRRSVGLNAAVAKTSAGAIEHVPVARVTNLSQAILTLKQKGYWVFGTDAEGTVRYDQADWSGPAAVVIGSEGEGLSASLRKHCDFLVSIPMSGKVNSLNAAVATGIIVFEATRQRQDKPSSTMER